MNKIKKRDEMPEKFKWDIEAMYSDEELWKKDIDDAITLSKELLSYKGELTKDLNTLLKALSLRDKIWLKAEKAFVYARMKRDEDNSVGKYQGMCDQSMSAVARISANLSFFVPELLASEHSVIKKYIDENDELKIYEFMLNEIYRGKKHILSEKEENLMASFSEVNSATGDIFTMLNNADMTFGNITDSDGNEIQLTHGNYISFMQEKNRDIRKKAYEKIYVKYKSLINTIATTYNYNTKLDCVQAKVRNYKNARASALFSDNVQDSVYENLISTINDNLPVLHHYVEMRKKILKIDKLQMYDIYAPLVNIPEKKIPYEEGVKMVISALAPMGEEYVSTLKKGFDDRWIDVYENEGKTSGAYSFGSYDSKPYVLLNYNNTLNDVFTVIHEMGHSMHSFYTRKTQPFIYGSHSIFTAEVASTVNENLLMKHLISSETDKEMKKYLIFKHIEDFRTTVFRQTMFAEFEDMTHKAIENGEVLTAEVLCDKYEKLNKKYYGNAVEDDMYIKYEWARIPHFYNAFYVYKYATGYCAASAISDIILKKGSADYIDFLKTGDSDYPIELLKIAGVDMSSPEPIRNAMKVFEELVSEFEKMVNQ